MKVLFCFLLLALSCQGFTKRGSAGRTIQTSGSQSDVQAAIDSAPDGSIVTIPSGIFDWSGTLNVNKAITLAGQGKDSTTIRNQNATTSMIRATSGKNGNTVVYGIRFVQAATIPGGVFMLDLDRTDSTHTVLVHDCSFDQNGVYAYAIGCRDNGFIIWNCDFTGTGYNGAGGISFVAFKLGYAGWNTPTTLGTKDSEGLHNSYIEDCSFKSGTTGMINVDDNARVVFRHDAFVDTNLTGHGQETSIYGARHWEIYNCTFKCDPTNALNANGFIGIRGGTGVVTGCTFDDIPGNKSKIALTVYSVTRGGADAAGSIFCPVEYPAPRQTGWGWEDNGANWGKVEDEANPQLLEGGKSPGYFLPNGKGAVLDPLYIWNNTGPGTQVSSFLYIYSYSPDNCGNNQSVESTYLRQGRDYYLDAGAKPGWTPYPYPHPLRGAGGPGPSPTPNPTATPLPTPTPNPSVTPQPTPTPPGKHQYQILMESDTPMTVTPLPQK